MATRFLQRRRNSEEDKVSEKLYARHYKLRDFVKNYRWQFALTSEFGKTDAYDLYHWGFLGKHVARNVLSNLRGPDLNASAFGLTTKGVIEFLKMFPEDKAAETVKFVLFTNIFHDGAGSAVIKYLEKNDKNSFRERSRYFWRKL